MSALFQWFLMSRVNHFLRGKKTWIFAGSLVLISLDHFLGTELSKELLGGVDLTNGEAVTSSLLGGAIAGLKASQNRKHKEVTVMLEEILKAAKTAAPTVLLAVLLIGCNTQSGFSLGNKLAGTKLTGSVSFDKGGDLAAGVTLLGQQGGISLALNPIDGKTSFAISGNVGLCDLLRSLGMPAPQGLCQ